MARSKGLIMDKNRYDLRQQDSYVAASRKSLIFASQECTHCWNV